MWRLVFPFLLAASSASAAPPNSVAPFTVAETGDAFFTLQAAVDAIGEGIGTILIAPGRYRDCAAQNVGRITYRARTPLTAVFDSEICEGKAVLIVRGRAAAVDGLVFQNLHVPDGNGAGIRYEKGELLVTRSSFRDSDEGILGGDDPDGAVRIEHSTFTRLGRCDGTAACAHSIYLGLIESVTVLRSRFEQGKGGHYVKSRAKWITVAESSFDDSKGQATNYMVDLPNGARGRIEQNVFVQGASKENRSAFIAVAAEGAWNSSDGLRIVGNIAEKVPEATWQTALLADWSESPKEMIDNDVATGIMEHKPINAGTDLGIIGTVKYWIWSFIKHIFGVK